MSEALKDYKRARSVEKAYARARSELTRFRTLEIQNADENLIDKLCKRYPSLSAWIDANIDGG